MRKYIQSIKNASFVMAIFCALAGMLSSCQREPLEVVDPNNSFDLVIRPRWIELDERPTGFTAIIYPTDGSTPKTIISNNVDSVKVTLPAGGYRVLVFNQTEEEFSSLTFRHMESYYDSQVMLAENTDDAGKYSIFPRSTLAKEPAVFASDCCNELYVAQHDIDVARGGNGRLRKILTMRPHIIISTLHIRLRVEGIYNGYAIGGCIDGMAGSVFPTYFEAGDNLGSFVIKDWKAEYDGVSKTGGYYVGKVKVFGMPGTSLYLSSSSSIETQTGTEYEDTRSGATRSKSDPTFKPEDILLHMRVLQVDRKTIFTQTFTVGDLIERRINDPLLFDLNIDEPVLELPYVKPADGSGASGFDAEVEDWIVIDNQIRF